MKHPLTMLAERNNAIQKCSPAASGFRNSLTVPLLDVFRKYFPGLKRMSIAKKNVLNVLVHCGASDIAMEAEKAYAIVLKMRKEKSLNKKIKLEARYRNYKKDFSDMMSLAKKLQRYIGKDMTFYKECGAVVRGGLLKYYPHLGRYGDTQLPEYGFYYYKKFIALGIVSAKLSNKKPR
jgi:hypothetical protein